MANDKIYIHEFIDILGHHRANYMHHMAANWSPTAQVERAQQCYGVWAVLGSTGRWPEVVNIWEHDGWAGLAESFATETVGRGAQDPMLEKWWAKAAEFRRGGTDRILEPAAWTRTIGQLCADGVNGVCYAHEVVRVRPGATGDLLDAVRDGGVPGRRPFGWKLAGAWRTAMGNDDECILLWAVPSWEAWADFERTDGHEPEVDSWRHDLRDAIEGWERILLVDAPLSPMRTGRQPTREDRTDWED